MTGCSQVFVDPVGWREEVCGRDVYLSGLCMEHLNHRLDMARARQQIHKRPVTERLAREDQPGADPYGWSA